MHRALACGLALWLASCSTETEPLTQIVVVVDSDFSGLTRFEANVEGFDEPTTVTAELDDEPLPRRFSLVHDGGPLGPMAVTVRAYTDEDGPPILVEPRTGMFFKAGHTLLLKVDLLSACVGLCEEGEACIAPGECVSSDDAAVLTPWQGQPDGLDVGGPLDGGMDSGMNMPDGAMNEAGTDDAGGDAEPPDPDSGPREDADVEPDAEPEDAEIDAGDGAVVPPLWQYVPSNVDLDDGPLSSLARSVLLVDCALATIDSTTPEASTFCHDAPGMIVMEQPGGGEILVVALSQLQVDSGMTLKLIGSRPVLFLVEGDANVLGTIEASAEGATSGPGADVACAGSTGGTGSDALSSNNGAYGASGGSGGGFGTPGSASGASGGTASIAGGALSGDATLVPLRGGCKGGAGGLGENVVTNAAPGGGGGALQLSVSGNLQLTGLIRAAGGGGGPGQGTQGGGGGGGSGGAVLIEASTFSIGATAIIAVNGGGGGGGQPVSGSLADSTAGGDGTATTTPSTAGFGANSGGDGGRGAALAALATSGAAAGNIGTFCPSTSFCNWGGGGGGAGGLGRIRIRGVGSCGIPGTFSPAPAIECESCGSCPAPPDPSCTGRSANGSFYEVCLQALPSASARTLCQASGLDLVKVDDQIENDFLVSQIPAATWYWIGAGDAVEDNWRWIMDDTQFWQGDETGAPVGGAFDAWLANEPAGNGDCGRVSSTGWADLDCNDSLPFICEQP